MHKRNGKWTRTTNTIPLFFFFIVDQKCIDSSVGNNMIAICFTLHLNAYYAILLDWTRFSVSHSTYFPLYIFHCIPYLYFHSYISNIFHSSLCTIPFTSNLFIQLEKSIILWTKMDRDTSNRASSNSNNNQKIYIYEWISCLSVRIESTCFTQYATA